MPKWTQEQKEAALERKLERRRISTKLMAENRLRITITDEGNKLLLVHESEIFVTMKLGRYDIERLYKVLKPYMEPPEGTGI